jgi:hypothetical protein
MKHQPSKLIDPTFSKNVCRNPADNVNQEFIVELDNLLDATRLRVCHLDDKESKIL